VSENQLNQTWMLPAGGYIRLVIETEEPLTEVVWKTDLPRLIVAIEELRIHLGGDL
jgi:hypothetical protein